MTCQTCDGIAKVCTVCRDAITRCPESHFDYSVVDCPICWRRVINIATPMAYRKPVAWVISGGYRVPLYLGQRTIVAGAQTFDVVWDGHCAKVTQRELAVPAVTI